MAERAYISRTTLRKLEAGDLSVSTAILARVLEVLGLEQDLDFVPPLMTKSDTASRMPGRRCRTPATGAGDDRHGSVGRPSSSTRRS